MGQYYIVANIDKKEYMRSNGGVKLMEWSYNRNDLILNLMNKLANEWKGDRVYIVEIDEIKKDTELEIKDIKNNWAYVNTQEKQGWVVLEKLEKELGIYNQKENGYYKTLYSFASDNFKELGVKELNKEEYKYIYNRFLLERYLKKYKFKYLNTKVGTLDILKLDTYQYFKEDKKIVSEEKKLAERFDKSRYFW